MKIISVHCLPLSCSFGLSGDLERELCFADGAVATPAAPGLGVTLTEDVEARYPYRPGSFYRELGHPGGLHSTSSRGEGPTS